MKQRNYFNNELLKNGVIVTAHKTDPLYQRFRVYVQQHPKRVVYAMLLIATINFGLMVYFVNYNMATPLVPSGIAKNAVNEIRATRSIGPDFSIGNYMKISRLKDSLDYLMKKKMLTGTDSLLFIRICSEYSKLDPSFSKAVNSIVHKNLK